MKNGWLQVKNDEEQNLYVDLLDKYVPNSDLNEYGFDIADPSDIVKLLWVQDEPVGFCTFKSKGSKIEEYMEEYAMLTLDTIFILPQYRRRGYVQLLLSQVMDSLNGDNFGLSSPISNSMRSVLGKFLKEKPHYYNRIWEVQYGGREGDRELVWYKVRRRAPSPC